MNLINSENTILPDGTEALRFVIELKSVTSVIS